MATQRWAAPDPAIVNNMPIVRKKKKMSMDCREAGANWLDFPAGKRTSEETKRKSCRSAADVSHDTRILLRLLRVYTRTRVHRSEREHERGREGEVQRGVVSHCEAKKSIPCIYSRNEPFLLQGGCVYLNLEGYLVKFDRLFSPSSSYRHWREREGRCGGRDDNIDPRA